MSLKIVNKSDDFYDNLLFNNESVGHADSIGVNSYAEIERKHFDKVSKFDIDDFFDLKIYTLAIPLTLEKMEFLNWLNPRGSDILISNEDEITVFLNPNILEWNKRVSFSSFFNRLREVFESENELIISSNEEWNLLEEGIQISINKKFKERRLNQLQNQISSFLNSKFGEVLNNLVDETEKNSLISVFSFPKEVQSACEQYLVYFSKFLEDLGIDAKTTIDSQTKSTLFTVTPNDSKEALSNIRDALNIYLSLPQVQNIVQIANEYKDIGVKQLASNISHLNSQLLLANAIIQVKDATIESLKFTNYRQTILIDSHSENQKNEEKTLGGLLTVNEIEGKGFKLNLPEIFRRIKRRFT